MSSINNVGGNSPVYTVNRTAPKAPAAATNGAEASRPTRGADKLELSGASQFLAALKTGGDVRADKVADIKAQIASGKYETDAKLDAATDKLLKELLG
jgi:negative regulator of flagellin synthesis FlgM